MGEKKLPLFMNQEQLEKEFGVSWSRDTLKRRIADGFPACKIGGSYLFETKKVIDWFRRREVR